MKSVFTYQYSFLVTWHAFFGDLSLIHSFLKRAMADQTINKTFLWLPVSVDSIRRQDGY